ncbi:hypothetical protein F511_19178 [Dorcoceras hygrometricum]|uniref:Uncharacterized protein n=1 Tax=Dorcoceras hygrometricum TaxID=472368 RepID=A0A2Z7A9K4_9LAMI|nr:hypothetical protein F511_19178 [Dorcoceras hygrometricum]
MGPISHTGPKTSRAARDRSEPKPRRNQTSLHDIAGASPERRPTGGGRHHRNRTARGNACGRDMCGASYNGFSVGHGVDPAGNAPGGG